MIAGHLCSTLKNFLIMEFDEDDAPWRDDVLSEPLNIENGCLTLSDKPGFGVDLNEKEIAKHPPKESLLLNIQQQRSMR